MSEHDDTDSRTVPRRTVLGGLAGMGALALAGNAAGESPTGDRSIDRTAAVDSHHPGEPRIVTVGDPIENPAFVGPGYIGGRDNLAPRLPDPSEDPDEYEGAAFSWSIAEKPDGSDPELRYRAATDDEVPAYDEGRDNVVEFEADVAGTYVLELDAPDGTHELTIRAFPGESGGAGGPPRIDLDGEFDSDADAFAIESDPKLAPNANTVPGDVEVEFIADDRDALSTDDIAVSGTAATVPRSALGGETARVHAVAFDGDAHSTLDTIVLDPDGPAVELPNRPPEWMREGVLYEIFTRSWAGERGETTFDVLAEGDEELGARGVDYLDELGVDAVWLTPVVPADSVEVEMAGGGPHGYDTIDYTDVSSDLGTLEDYRNFVEACHERDIKVVFDLVINHCGRSNALFQDTIADQGENPDDPDEWPIVREWNEESPYFDWFDRVEEPFDVDGERLEPEPRATGFWGLQSMPNLNFDNLALREYLLAVADFWSGEVGVDGFRCDIAWGVPHGFWKVVRERCRANDSEFLLLDETIPKDPKYTENEFDMHFDTGGFTTTAHQVGRGEADGRTLFDDVVARDREGFPDHTLLLNATENHDEERLLNTSLDGAREDPAKTQRACFAAGVTLPGVPMVYYGQERQISVYGEGRHRGEGDDRTGDVNPGGKQRAFMNWDEYDEDHLAFYRDLVSLYHDLDVLKPDADLARCWYDADDDVLVFGRDANDVDDVDGPERAIVAVNFGADPAEIDLRPAVSSIDEFSGADLATDGEGAATTVEVETVAVFETPSLLSIGDRIVSLDAESGTDYGPGDYEYPTGDRYEEGTFDVVDLSVHETADRYQFVVGVGGTVGDDLGPRHLQFYLHDPDADGGSTEMRRGVNADLEAPHQHRVVATPAEVAVEEAAGTAVATGSVSTNPVDDTLLVEFPKGAIDGDLADLSVAALLLGYDPDAEGGVLPVEAEASEDAFGGAENASAPNVIDLVVPEGADRDDALAYGDDELATIAYVPLSTAFEALETYESETGVAYGPGTYEVPTGDDYYEEAWDLDELRVSASRDEVRFEFEMAAEIQNPWNFDPGFCHQFVQIYVHDPDAEGEPEAVEGREATNVAFESPYHYRIVAHGEGVAQVESADGSGVSSDVVLDASGRTIEVTVPRDAIGFDDGGVAIAPTMMPYDGFGDGGLRPILADADEHAIGGGHDDDIDPAVMDMVTPEGVDRVETLSAYGEGEPPLLPYVALGEVDLDALPTSDLDAIESDDEEYEGTSADEYYDDEDDENGEDDENDEDDEENGDGNGDDAADESASDADDDGGEGSEDGTPGFGPAVGAAGAIGGAAIAARRLGSSDDEDR